MCTIFLFLYIPYFCWLFQYFLIIMFDYTNILALMVILIIVLTLSHSFTFILPQVYPFGFFVFSFFFFGSTSSSSSFFQKAFIRAMLPEFLHIWKYLSVPSIIKRQLNQVKVTGSYCLVLKTWSAFLHCLLMFNRNKS